MNEEPDFIAKIDQACEEQKQVARLYAVLYQAFLGEGLKEDVARAFVCARIAGCFTLWK